MAEFVAEPMETKSCVKRTLEPGSFVARMASIGTVAPAVGGVLLTMRRSAIVGPIVRSVAKVLVNGSPAARLPARSNTLLTTSE